MHTCCIAYSFVTVERHTQELVCQNSNLCNEVQRP